jgi:heme exporter protein D
MQDFFAMGGYAGFVWPSYLIAAAIMAGLWWRSSTSARRSEATLNALRSQDRAENSE